MNRGVQPMHKRLGVETPRRTKAVEYSSEIRSFKVKNGKSEVSLYYTTPPARFPDNDPDHDPSRESPGMSDPLHGPLNGHSRACHIHFHWLGSTSKSKGTRSDNRTFSEADIKTFTKYWQDKYFLVLGPEGTLHVKYPNELPMDGGFPDRRQGRYDIPLEHGLYGPKPPLKIRRVYKQ